MCFSAGEGLRLTPFPVSPHAADAPRDARLRVASSLASLPHKYGPVDMPVQAQAQKRGKRQMPDCACPPAQSVRMPAADLHHDSGVRPPAAFASILSAAEPADRAPPCLV